MIAVDTSVVVAAFASWHEGHRVASECLRRQPRLPCHAAVEAFSVLTRLPPPHRAPAEVVGAFLRSRFTFPFLALPGRGHQRLLAAAVSAGLTGGAIYDALIAATANHANAVLLSRDRRAAITYELMGAKYELLA